MRPGGARRAPVRVPGVVAQGQGVPAVVTARNPWEADTLERFGPDMVAAYREAELEVRAKAAARQRARDRSADGMDMAGDLVSVRKSAKPGDRA